MHLALAIGGVTLDELDERMSEREFMLWNQYEREFFLPHRRADLQAAQIAYWASFEYVKRSGPVNLDAMVVKPASREEQPDAEFGGAVIGAMSSRKVIMLGQGRKAKADGK